MTAMQDSIVPAALDALVALAETCVPDESFKVLDGPTDNMNTLPKFILIGWSGLPDTRGVEPEMADAGPGGRQAEKVDVHGLVQVQLGASKAATQKAARDQAFAVHNKLAAGIKNDPTLGLRQGTRAVMRRYSVEPYIGSGGGCAVHFTIHIEGTR